MLPIPQKVHFLTHIPKNIVLTHLPVPSEDHFKPTESTCDDLVSTSMRSATINAE